MAFAKKMNFCFMTYGQTSAGKTFTLFGEPGSEELEGMVPRLARKLFEKLGDLDSSDEDSFSFSVSCFEIYKEKIFDLLDSDELKRPLNLREDPKRGVYVEGLQSRPCRSEPDLMSTLGVAQERRRASETTMNARSSRSHFVTIFDLEIRSQLSCPKTEAEGAAERIELTKRSKLIFLDLAGSERQGLNSTEVLQEGCHINRSLSILQHVLLAMSRKEAKSFVHYRDSK